MVALRTLNVAPLGRYYAGAALQKILGDVRSLNPDEEEVHVLHAQSEGQVSVLDANQARVELVERWSVTVYRRSDRACLAHLPAYDVPQAVTLERVEGAWRIVNFTFYDSQQPAVVPCPA